MSGRKLFRAKSFGKKTVHSVIDDARRSRGCDPAADSCMDGKMMSLCCDCGAVLRCICPPAVSQEVQLGEEAAEEGVVKKRRLLNIAEDFVRW